MTRAQEAEENYVIKRELAVVRQQCNTASESLEKAQDTIRELQQQKVNSAPESAHKHYVDNMNHFSVESIREQVKVIIRSSDS